MIKTEELLEIVKLRFRSQTGEGVERLEDALCRLRVVVEAYSLFVERFIHWCEVEVVLTHIFMCGNSWDAPSIRLLRERIESVVGRPGA